MSEPRAVRVDEFLPHAPARVWRALTDPDLLAEWLMPNDFQPVAGHRFTFRTDPRPNAGFDGVVHCEVLDVEPERLLRFSWRGGPLDTTVTWTLVPEGRGTRLFLEHDGFDPDDPAQRFTRRILDGGWRSNVMSALRAVLDQTARG
ncbi:SRPBCC domain-containing protein [Actinomadura sp. DC4]|uniref:SRPBCC family protein n=1 Tax=Actinomadura sp. DC4 TaxID=3055069 RepID=UPI0025AEEC33|nr:SRPBCC domain-containing protein [Actinomadura sp. DC4]MDN3356979.1 SRPBCC domain-containing protein [Actinomadura sp. DC4]